MNLTQRNGTMLLVLVLIGINMRPLLTSVGPLLPQIQQASGMSFTLASLLTALPVIAMGLLALAGGWINRHFSERQSISLSLLTIVPGLYFANWHRRAHYYSAARSLAESALVLFRRSFPR